MRKFIIDTDTASDDAVAIVMALRSKIEVLAITTVAGNVSLEQATKNAKVSIAMANTYQPPIYEGSAKPLKRDLITSTDFHGEDGMGNMFYNTPNIKTEPEDAVSAMISLIETYPHEIELVAIGPLTNIALLIQKSPKTIHKIKSIYIMGGNGYGPGNINDHAEFNFYADAEAAKIVLDSKINPILFGWDVSLQDTYISEIDFIHLRSKIGQFTINANKAIIEFNQRENNKTGFVLPDPGVMAVALEPEIITESKLDTSTVAMDPYGKQVFGTGEKITQVTRIDQSRFKEMIFNLSK